ncbi:hypothetical protein [Cellulomonas wangsupingiae]|uniref:hypothetical protein n=1 Tax=Cellulomonas wangsupingiae TaxID=2968085 RepID=UPI001D0EBB5E|nr:hypothetical protein [Cellulomonas wangsupingiae]MCM0639926.1 hypothetical protein [Cellulomonas wangsupingiae]
MRTQLRRVLPAALVVGGLALAAAGVALGAGESALFGAVLLVMCGAATWWHPHLPAPRHAAHLTAPAVGWGAPVVPPRRGPGTTPAAVVPSPRGAPVLPIAADDVLGLPSPWTDVARSGGPQRAGAPARVRPYGGLPHQRRASNGS